MNDEGCCRDLMVSWRGGVEAALLVKSLINGLFGWFEEGKLDETAPWMILWLTA